MNSKLPKATHEGILDLNGTFLDVAVLENGQRIITQSGVFKALGRDPRGNARIDHIPAFMDAKNIQAFVKESVKEVIKRVEYTDKKNKVQQGYDANILPVVAELYLKARENGVLLNSQIDTAHKAEILIRSLARLAITAMIDEATGYQYEREKDELQKILKKYISNELLAWQKTFPDTFYSEIFRLNKWDYTVQNIRKRPGVVGTWTNKVIYEQLPKGVLEELKKKTPKSTTGNYTARFFQSLTSDTGHPHLSAQLNQVIALMRISDSWQEFIANFNKMINRKNGQLELNLSDFEPKEDVIIQQSNFNQNLKKALDYKPKDKQDEE